MIPIFGFLELFLILPMLALGLLGTIFWVWMLVDCALNEPGHSVNKIVWILIILFTHFIGALLYFIFRRCNRAARPGSGFSG